MIGYIDTEDLLARERLESLAKAMHPEYVFAIATDIELASSEGIDVPALAVHQNSIGEKTTLLLLDDMTKTVANVRKAARPLIADLTIELHEGLLDVRERARTFCGHKLIIYFR